MGCGFGPEFCYSLVASCGVAGLFSARPRDCVEWAGYYLVPRRPAGLAGFGPCGGMGRHTTLKMWRPGGRAGSSPATGTCVLMGLGGVLVLVDVDKAGTPPGGPYDDLSDAEILERFQPVHYGPTWERGEDGRFVLPEHTLGWEIARWCSDYLEPLGADQEVFEFTLEQLRIVLWWYAVDDEGKFIYRRRGVLQRIKGWGKDPLLAVLCLVEAFGPSRFAGWGSDGEPVGRRCPQALVQIFALKQEQTSNTFDMFHVLVGDKMRAKYGADVKLQIVRGCNNTARIEVKTSSFRSTEGNRCTFALLNEALDVDTVIPTPAGARRMGDLVAGDEVYGPDGMPVRVVEAKPVQVGRDCYRVTVGGVDSVVASDGHLWMTRVASSAAKPRIRSTREMVEDGRRFMVPRSGPRVLPVADLPVDPYVLGYWLGDGSTGDCNITVGLEDEAWVTGEFERRGYPLHRVGNSGTPRLSFSGRAGFGADMGPDYAQAFRALPCYWDKHIPDVFMESSVEQRLDLLRGLMDSDGCARADGYAVFVGCDRLAEQVFELAASLGFLPHKRYVVDERSRDGGYWQVGFMIEGLNPFLMPRKAERSPLRERREWVSIDIEQVESRPVRCIAVGNESHLFQASHCVVTHNTQHWLPQNNGQKLKNTVEGNTTKMKSRYLAITNAYKPGEGSVAEDDREAFMKSLEGLTTETDVFYDSLEAPDDTPLDERVFKVLYNAVRGDSVWCDADEAWRSVLNPSRPTSESRRMYLNQVWQPEGNLFSSAEWKRIERKATLEPGDRVVLGFDGGKSDDSTALVAIRVSDGLMVPLLLEEKPLDLAGDWEVDRERVDSMVHRCFRDYDVVGFYADVALWESYIHEWTLDYGERLVARASDRGPIAWDMRGSRKRTVNLHEAFMAAILDGKVSHGGSRELAASFRRHVLNVLRKDTPYGVSFMKAGRESKKKIDMYAAAMLAFGAYRDYQTEMASRPVAKAGGSFFRF